VKHTLVTFISRYAHQLVILSLAVLVLVGFGARVWRLESAPRGALIDELHFGYLAHSLIETGKDEHGEPWPIIFRAFGDEKLPAMAYLDIPSVAVFGLSLTAIRMPSVIAGTLLILVSFWLLRELKFSRSLALFGALITAVSPWTFFLSRFGFESNIALLFFMIGLAALARALSNITARVRWWYALAGAAFGLTWYSYIAYRPITAVLLLAVYGFLLWRKQLTKVSLVALLAMALVIAPLFQPKVVGVNSTRFEQVGVLSDPSMETVIIEKRNFCTERLPTSICYAVFNKPLYLLRQISFRYLSSFSPEFLTTTGEGRNDFLTIDGFGQFYPFFYPFFVIGLGGFLLIKKPSLSSTHLFIIVAGLLLAPVPSALVGEPQKVRISALYPFILMSIVFGISIVMQLLQKKLQRLALFGFALASLFFFVLYSGEYFGVHTSQHEYMYQSYVPEISLYASTLPDSTLVNFRPFYSDPLMFYAFYTQMPPAEYQSLAELGELEPGGFQHTVALGNKTAYKTNITAFGCAAKELGQKAVFITDEKIDHAVVLYEAKASNNVHTYAYAYDASFFVKDIMCEEVL